MHETITSVQNTRVKNLVRLRDGSHRRRQKRFLVEGRREIERAMDCRWPVETLFFCEELFKVESAYTLLERCDDAGIEVVRMTPLAFAKCAYRQGPDGLLATAEQKDRPLEEMPLSDCPLLGVIEGIEKPGNIGAIMRTASAAGIDALILTGTVTDPYNPNVIRASQGAFFDIPFCATDNASLALFLEERSILPILTSPAGKEILWSANLREPVAVFFGSEDTGLSSDWLDNYPSYLLPMSGVTDSLNVASMAAVTLFEAVRQRSSF